MTHKAIGIETKHVYIIGTKPECMRYVNSLVSESDNFNLTDRRVTRSPASTHREPIRILPINQTLQTDDELLEQARKEWQLSELQNTGKSRKPHTPTENKIEWTAEKENWLIEHAHIGLRNLPDMFKKRFGETATVSALKNRAYKLNSERGLELFTQNKWTAEDDAYLIANHATSRHKQMAAHLGRTDGAVGTRVKRLIEMGLLQRKKNSGYFRGGNKDENSGRV